MLKRGYQRLRKTFSVLTTPHFIYSIQDFSHHQISFSQEGEDCILNRIFERKKLGFYVDVGAHHPQRFSNTYRFYLRGWQGINIDPLPGTKEEFDRIRPRDINLQMGISDSALELTYYQFEEPAFNTFLADIAEQRTSPLIAKTPVKTHTLSQVLREYLPIGQSIDFMSIDVEGFDLQVLKSNDWRLFRPSYVLSEILGIKDMDEVMDTDLVKFMNSVNYSVFSRSVNTVFFVDNLSK